MERNREILHYASKEAADCRPASQPGDSQNLEQYRRRAKWLDDAKIYQQEVESKHEEDDRNDHILDNKIILQEEISKDAKNKSFSLHCIQSWPCGISDH